MCTIQTPSDEELTLILSTFLKTVPAIDRPEAADSINYVMAKDKLDAAVLANPSFQHLIDVGALSHV
jgi:hypothetical protein